jgi:hypothetical protein
MAAVLRPNGDHLAAVYGPYMREEEVKKITKGDKLDVLCEDGLHYHAVVKETGITGRLHFHHWSVKRHDYTGSFDELYLQTQGTYSEGISAQNTYAPLTKAGSSGDRIKVTRSTKSASNKPSADCRRQNFSSGTRYPEDFLSKPRSSSSHNRKRSADESEDSDSKRTLQETPEIEISVRHEKATDIADQNIADGASDNTSDFPRGIDDTSMVAHDRRDKSNSRNKRTSNDKKPQIQKSYVQELNSADGTTKDSVDQIDDKLDDAAVPSTSSRIKTESGSTAVMSNEEDRDKLSPVVEEILSSSASSTANSLPENNLSSAASNCEYSSAAQQVSRVIPAYQLQVQRAAQIKYLREMLAMEKSITDTGRAVDTIMNHPIVFNSGNPSSQCTAQELLGLLQARRKIDEVIHHILGTL